MENEEKQTNEPNKMGSGSNGIREENKEQMKTNLQILLSQNDIIHLLKRVNKDSQNKGGNVSLAKYLFKKEKVEYIFIYSFFFLQKTSLIAARDGINARQMNRNLENENFTSDSEDEAGKRIAFNFNFISNSMIFRIHQTRKAARKFEKWAIKRVPNGVVELVN